MSFQANITVLQDFDGFKTDVVEVVSRKIQSTGRGSKTKYFISYKGKRADVFYLNKKVYDGITSGNCISLRSGF